PDGTTETGHTGNGYARITYIAPCESEEFDYTGNVQTFTAPKDGYYNIECWGASGGNTKHSTQEITVFGGKGAYTQGLIYLNKGTTLYIYVGGQASDDSNATEAGWNGGGKENDIYNQARSGGGATDIRLVEDTTSANGWSDFDSLKSRIMVAAGGGGSAIANTNYTTYVGNGGDGGTLEGLISNNLGSYAQNYYGTGATQTSAGYAINNSSLGLGGFGYGGNGSTSMGGGQSAGGGGGYYGGGGAGYCAPGGGGSSFISGYNGCNAISESSTSTNIVPTGQAVHYSGKYFVNGVMKAGNESTPDYSSDDDMTGNSGDGHARITLVG
ncbi:MAG: glycine rich domain-containing protein, partial [Acutalibacteraceae bacterium]